MKAVVLVGHGSLRSGSGAAMIRLAARLRSAGVAPIAAAGFLNYSRPTLAEALERCIAQGTTDIAVVPYFLVPGYFAAVTVPRALEPIQHQFPAVSITLTRCFDDHHALAELVSIRAIEALPAHSTASTALLLMAHGSPNPAANRPLFAIAERLVTSKRFETVVPSFLDLNDPSIPDAMTDLVERGHRRIVAVPYFLQLGGHVAEDLPQIIATAQRQHAGTQISLASHLGYHPLLVDVIRDRVSELADPPSSA